MLNWAVIIALLVSPLQLEADKENVCTDAKFRLRYKQLCDEIEDFCNHEFSQTWNLRSGPWEKEEALKQPNALPFIVCSLTEVAEDGSSCEVGAIHELFVSASKASIVFTVAATQQVPIPSDNVAVWDGIERPMILRPDQHYNWLKDFIPYYLDWWQLCKSYGMDHKRLVTAFETIARDYESNEIDEMKIRNQLILEQSFGILLLPSLIKVVSKTDSDLIFCYLLTFVEGSPGSARYDPLVDIREPVVRSRALFEDEKAKRQYIRAWWQRDEPNFRNLTRLHSAIEREVRAMEDDSESESNP